MNLPIGPILIETDSGKVVDALNPKSSEIDINDIAHNLSNLCRFAGSTKQFYSVAQHCCHLSDLCDEEYRLAALLHDAGEAYIGDLIQPIKSIPEIYKIVSFIENSLLRAVLYKFSVPDWDENPHMWSYILDMDKKLAFGERMSCFNNTDLIHTWRSLSLDNQVRGPDRLWGSELSEDKFLRYFKELYDK